jgi:hypothetical protein
MYRTGKAPAICATHGHTDHPERQRNWDGKEKEEQLPGGDRRRKWGHIAKLGSCNSPC